MVKKIASLIVSTRLTAILFLTFSAAMGVGTFVESMHGTDAAKILIYNAFWFELMMLLFLINFIFNIKRYNLLSRPKMGILLMHLSWILIIIGAGITRYIGYEGVMPIREGKISNEYLSSDTYLTVLIDGQIDNNPLRRKFEKKLLLSEYTQYSNDFIIKNVYNKHKFQIEYLDFTENVDYTVVESEKGNNFIKIVEASKGDRHEHYVEEGQVVNVHGVLFSFNNYTDTAINFIYVDEELFIQSSFNGTFMRMIDQKTGTVNEDIIENLQLRSLYNIAGLQFVIPDGVVKGNYEVTKVDEETEQNSLKLRITTTDLNNLKEYRDIELFGGKGITDNYERVRVAGLDFSLKYGSIISRLPFSIKLNDFIAERYPGTEKSYSSFKSKVTVEDEEVFDYDIYMNNILNHKGYRFFQASFDPDELGTILSVNKDFFGTLITYIGYILLYVGLLATMFYGRTRFKDLSRKLNNLKINRNTISFLLLFFTFTFSNAQVYSHNNGSFISDSIVNNYIVSTDHANKFGELIIQDSGGRMKPINTFSSELLRKVSKSDTYKNLSSDQVLLSILRNPLAWYSEPIIYIKRGNDSIRSILGIDKKQKYARFMDFFDSRGNYKISTNLENAYKSSLPNQFEKDFIESDRKVNLLFSALEGDILRIFPAPKNINNKWVSYSELKNENFQGIDSLFVNNIFPLYLRELDYGLKNNDYTKANGILESIKGYQLKYSPDIIPSENKIKAEVLYNKINVFEKLFIWYFTVGMIYFLFIIFDIFSGQNSIKKFMNAVFILFRSSIFILFIVHTLALIARWFISGHAPWGDAYESMIYVAWATMGIGLLFAKKSDLTLAATAFVSSMILMIAHWNWMDPSIANLVPVLDSYWLMIHVSVIVGSYGPFALGMILGIVSLILMIFLTKRNKNIVKLKLKELTIINELALTVGLIMLTIGNFLGGMWANESWGRYWGWDPKETWALISILIYAFVLHMRLIPKLKGNWMFNLMSIIAFASIMMTYFGVNFYLVGLHSYASGDKVITPTFVYWSILFVFLLAVLSKYKYNKYLSR